MGWSCGHRLTRATRLASWCTRAPSASHSRFGPPNPHHHFPQPDERANRPARAPPTLGFRFLVQPRWDSTTVFRSSDMFRNRRMLGCGGGRQAPWRSRDRGLVAAESRPNRGHDRGMPRVVRGFRLRDCEQSSACGRTVLGIVARRAERASVAGRTSGQRLSRWDPSGLLVGFAAAGRGDGEMHHFQPVSGVCPWLRGGLAGRPAARLACGRAHARRGGMTPDHRPGLMPVQMPGRARIIMGLDAGRSWPVRRAESGRCPQRSGAPLIEPRGGE